VFIYRLLTAGTIDGMTCSGCVIVPKLSVSRKNISKTGHETRAQ
jgi:hypothetical protein